MGLSDSGPPSLLSMWVIYERPRDMPSHPYVARRHEVFDDGPRPTQVVFVGLTLKEVRDQLPRGLVRLPRHLDDDLTIVESWF